MENVIADLVHIVDILSVCVLQTTTTTIVHYFLYLSGNLDVITCPESCLSFHSYPYNYSQFIECNNRKTTVVACIEGLHFDPD